MTATASGLLVIDKPSGLSSHDVVARVRRIADIRKVGHAGTLDPMATGVLVLGLGRGTRLLHYLVGADKQYLATVRLGASTTTDDAEGEVTHRAERVTCSDEQVRCAVTGLTGVIDQIPSAVSAIKVDGRRAYARARAGEDVRLEPRRVTVSTFDVIATTRCGDGLLDLEVHVACSSGTYVRALARDLGLALGVGGHLVALRRTRVGPFTLEEAHQLERLPTPVTPAMLPLGTAAGRFLPRRTLTEEEAARVRHGVAPAPSNMPGAVALLDSADHLLAVAEDVGPRAHLRAVFAG